MASNEAITSGNDGDMIELIEDDIPGAKLTGAVDGYTMSELKWWLLCRGVKAPNSWNKKQLILRYFKSYFVFIRCLIPSWVYNLIPYNAMYILVTQFFQNPRCCSRKATNCRRGW